MHALVLAFLFGVPPQAPPVVLPQAPAVIEAVDKPGSFQAWAAVVAANPLPDHTGEPIVVEEPPCDCGESCRCVDCQCEGCPHRTVKDSLTGAPPLVITVADSNCPPCERFKQDALVRLVRAGWVETQHYTLRVVPFGSERVPSFAWHGVPFSTAGYGDWLSWRAELKRAMGDAYNGPAKRSQGTGETPTTDSGRHDARVSSVPGWHSHQCPCGFRWSHDANTITDFYAAHTCRRCGRLVTVHAE